MGEAKEAASDQEKNQFYEKAIDAFKAELALSPVTELSIAVTGDLANNALVHYLLAEVYEALKRYDDAILELDDYLKASRWHSDTYPWRIPLAEKKIEELRTMRALADAA